MHFIWGMRFSNFLILEVDLPNNHQCLTQQSWENPHKKNLKSPTDFTHGSCSQSHFFTLPFCRKDFNFPAIQIEDTGCFPSFPKNFISNFKGNNNELFSWNTFININQPHRTNKTIASQYCSWKTVNDLPVQQQASGQTIYNTSRPAVWTPLPSEKLLRLSENFYLFRLYICML